MSSVENLTGRVVAVESYYYDGLTDFWAMVWNPETGEVVSGPACSCNTQVDAPAWVVAFYAIAKESARRERAARDAAAKAAAEAEAEACRPSYGKTVVVVRGRKIKKGTEATVFWLGETRWGWRVGLEMADGSRDFTDAGNVEVVEGPSRKLVGSAHGKAAA